MYVTFSKIAHQNVPAHEKINLIDFFLLRLHQLYNWLKDQKNILKQLQIFNKSNTPILILFKVHMHVL